MNILLLLAHSIEEHDQIRLLSSLGYDVFSIGGYIDPAHPHDPKRPALPGVSRHEDLKAVVDGLGTSDNLAEAKRRIPDALIDWSDVIICHHYEYNWLWPQWDRIQHKRVIWRTVGQSTQSNEEAAATYRSKGLQIVRYSPREEWIPGYAGRDALIRFYKDPDEWTGWTGSNQTVINITQHLIQRGDATNGRFWLAATAGVNAQALGPGSHVVGGPGEMTLEEMKVWLQQSRAYLYTGTQPASYTLGFIEAYMTGIPIVSIGRAWMKMYPRGGALFEPPDWVPSFDDPRLAREHLVRYLEDAEYAQKMSVIQREFAIKLFGMETIGQQWKEFLG